MLQSDHELPDLPSAPPPWTLSGSGTILLLRPSADDRRFTPPALKGRRCRGVAVAMLVDYQDSAVGPYRELLFIPGRFDFDGGRRYSITSIYVSTMASVVNGRRNWGIPKDLAAFEPGRGAHAVESMRVSVADRTALSLRLGCRGPRLPFNAALIPPTLRTLSQMHAGRQFTLTPSARGWIQPAQVLQIDGDGCHFPRLTRDRVLACLHAPAFRMLFPPATVVSSTERGA